MNSENIQEQNTIQEEQTVDVIADEILANENITDDTVTNNTDTPEGEDEDTPEIPKKKLPLFCKILFGMAGVCVPLYILFVIFPSFSDIFNKYISPVPRAFLATLTGWIPFSLSEYLLILLPVIFVVVVGYGVKHYSDSWRNIGVFCLIMLSIASYIFSTFTIAFVPAYRGSRLDVKMGLDKQEVSADDLLYTAIILVNELEKEAEAIQINTKGASVMPYGYEELNDKLMEAYDTACKKYDFIQPLNSKVKRIMLSEPMTYTHISGVYTFFTGEANINTNFPDFTLPYTTAHELAHQRGIAREDEANFVAFLVCSQSEDAYIRYSAYLSLFQHVGSALNSANPEYYKAIYSMLPQAARLELSAYSKFFDKYRDSVASNVSGTINDTFLTINGTEGTKSYGMVVDLAVAYYKQ